MVDVHRDSLLCIERILNKRYRNLLLALVFWFFSGFFFSDELCKSGNQLACAGGDLTAKHGRLTLGEQQGARLVFTDPFLPLSGPNSGNTLIT